MIIDLLSCFAINPRNRIFILINILLLFDDHEQIPMLHFLSHQEPARRPLWVRPLTPNSFKSELKEFPFLSEEEKTNPPTQQTWEEIRNPKLRRHPDCKKILVEELIDDHGMEGYVFKVDIDGTGPFVLKIVLVQLLNLSGM